MPNEYHGNNYIINSQNSNSFLNKNVRQICNTVSHFNGVICNILAEKLLTKS